MGKSAPDPPDYTPVANASAESAAAAERLGNRQLNMAQEQFDWLRNSGFLEMQNQLAQNQMDWANQQMDWGNQQMAYRSDIMDEAKRFNTEAYQEQLASQAAADVGQAFNVQSGMRERRLASMGVDPSSGASRGLARKDANAMAAARAGAMTGARQQAEQTGFANQMAAAGLNAGPTAALAAASNAGQAAAGANMGGLSGAQGMSNMLLSGANQGAGLQMQGLGMNLQGLQGIMGSQTSIYGNQLDYNSAMAQGLGQFAGLAMNAIPWSDRRLKQDIIEVGEYDNGLPSYEFAYTFDPDTRYRGVMADDVAERFPEAVMVDADGFQRVDYDYLGIEMEQVS